MKQSELKDILEYDPATGVFTWLARPATTRANKIFNTKFTGKIAGCFCPRGYQYLKINQRMCAAGHLAWLYVHGELPPDEIDHKDGNPSNNRLDNLRPATRSQNGANRGLHRNSASGVKGVYYSQSKRKWVSQAGGKNNRIVEYFDSKEAADAAYRDAAERLFGEFARAA